MGMTLGGDCRNYIITELEDSSKWSTSKVSGGLLGQGAASACPFGPVKREVVSPS